MRNTQRQIRGLASHAQIPVPELGPITQPALASTPSHRPALAGAARASLSFGSPIASPPEDVDTSTTSAPP